MPKNGSIRSPCAAAVIPEHRFNRIGGLGEGNPEISIRSFLEIY